MNWANFEKKYPLSYKPIRDHFETLGKLNIRNPIESRNILIDYLHERGYLVYKSGTFIKGIRLMEKHLKDGSNKL